MADPSSRHPSSPTDADFRRAEAAAAAERAQALRTVIELAPLTIAANLLNAIMVASIFGGEVSSVELAGWLVAIGLAILLPALAWHRNRRRPIQVASARAINRTAFHALLLGTTWGLVPLRLYEIVPSDERMIMAFATAGLICAGGFILSPIPKAAFTFVAVLGTLSATAFLAQSSASLHITAALIVAYLAVVGLGVAYLSRVHVQRSRAEAKAAKQSQVIGLLLRDFEEQTSDLLWEIDAAGIVRHASPRFAEAVGLPPGAVEGLGLVPLLEQAESFPRQEAFLAQLRAKLSERNPFRDIVIRLQPDGSSPRWWSLTAKPLLDAMGRDDGWRGLMSDVTESRRTHESLVRLAHHCTLTGLANRHRFLTLLHQVLDRPATNGMVAVLYIDLDDFKKVNDAKGHRFGDAFLKRFARQLQRLAGTESVVGRLGGDEFAVVLEHVENLEEARARAQSMIDMLPSTLDAHGRWVGVGMSIGVAAAPLHGRQPEELMRAADVAMYAAKAAGKRTVAVYSEALGYASRRRRALEDGLRDAIEYGELRLMFQPQFSADGLSVESFEALLRWHHPEMGEIGPAEFILVAEECGQIEMLGNWVLHEACRRASDWPADIGIAVNVSPVQAMRPGLVAAVRSALAASRIDARRLELEITESVFLDSASPALANLHTLRALGVRIALDDFGIGYSSLGYLRRFPFDTLKIDRAFTSEVDSSDQARALVTAIATMAASFGMTVVAEGVERTTQLEELRAAQCARMQGYLFARPLEVDAIDTWLAQRGIQTRTRSMPPAFARAT